MWYNVSMIKNGDIKLIKKIARQVYADMPKAKVIPNKKKKKLEKILKKEGRV